MKKKIVILGSTGSIGVNTLKVIGNNKKDFEIVLLSTNKNVKKIIHQAKEFKVKNIIINDSIEFKKAQKKRGERKRNAPPRCGNRSRRPWLGPGA